MYARQALKLLSFWIIDICVTIVLKVLMVLCIPLILIWSRFGMDWTQQSAQASFDLSGLLIRGWSKPPPTDWRLFFGRPRRQAADNRVVSGEVLPPLEDRSDLGV